MMMKIDLDYMIYKNDEYKLFKKRFLNYINTVVMVILYYYGKLVITILIKSSMVLAWKQTQQSKEQ